MFRSILRSSLCIEVVLMLSAHVGYMMMFYGHACSVVSSIGLSMYYLRSDISFV